MVRTEPAMPPMGVADLLLAESDGVERFRFWLLTHTGILYATGEGEAFWRTAVLRECVPLPDTLEFEACASLLGGS